MAFVTSANFPLPAPPGLESEVIQPAEHDLPANRFFAPKVGLKKVKFGSVCASGEQSDNDTESTADSSYGTADDDSTCAPALEGGVEQLPSIGSVGHAEGLCRPCHYAPTKRGCSLGKDCDFCHFVHPKRCKKRAPHSERGEALILVQAVYDAERGGDVREQHYAEAKLLMFVSPNPRRAAYASAVLRGLRSGAVLHSTESHV